MGLVEIRTRMVGSILLLTVALTNLATEIINIMKEHITFSSQKTSQKTSQKRHKNVTQLK